MSQETVLAVLNELLAAEQRAVAPRLLESVVFVSGQSVAMAQLASQMLSQSSQCQHALAERVSRLGGEPRLRCGSLESADLHFQELHRVLPRLIIDHERLVAKYRAAGERVGGDEVTAAMVSRFLQVHERELDSLSNAGTSQVSS